VLSGWWQYSNLTTGPAQSGQVRTSADLDSVGEQGTIWLHPVDDDGLDWSLVSVGVGDHLVMRSVGGETWTLTVNAVGDSTAGLTVTLDSATTVAPKRNQRVQVSLSRASGGGGGVTDHGALTGLADDDHTQYGLVVVAAAKPGSPRVGTIWVPSG
jgi:hypothetical protein